MVYIALTLVVIYQRRTSQWLKRILFSVCVNKTYKNVFKCADNKHENARFPTVFFAMTRHRTVVYDRRAQQGWRTEKRVQFERALIGLHIAQSVLSLLRPIEACRRAGRSKRTYSSARAVSIVSVQHLCVATFGFELGSRRGPCSPVSSARSPFAVSQLIPIQYFTLIC